MTIYYCNKKPLFVFLPISKTPFYPPPLPLKHNFKTPNANNRRKLILEKTPPVYSLKKEAYEN